MDDSRLLHMLLRGTLKAAAWERAKGALRELSAIDGSEHGGARDEGGKYRHEHVQDQVEAFIKNFEDEGLHE